MVKLLHDFDEHLKNDTFKIFDDFHHYVSADLWTTQGTDSGTVSVSDAVGGVVVVDPSDSTQADNDQTYMHQTTEIFKFATDKPIYFAARVRPVSNTIGNANFLVGLKNAPTTDQLADDGAVPAITGSGAFFYKLDGGTYWVCTATANGSESTTNGVTTEHTVGNNAWDILVIEAKPISSTETEVHFFSADYQTDGSYSLKEVGKQTSGNQFVAQRVTHTSATEMEVVFGVKEGAVNLTTELHVDWVFCSQKR